MAFRGENFGGENTKSSRGRRGKWKREDLSSASGEPELATPLAVEKVEDISETVASEEIITTPVANTPESDDVTV